jgi:hypothetical protein
MALLEVAVSSLDDVSWGKCSDLPCKPAMPAGRNTYVVCRFFTATTPRTFLLAGTGVQTAGGDFCGSGPILALG